MDLGLSGGEHIPIGGTVMKAAKGRHSKLAEVFALALIFALATFGARSMAATQDSWEETAPEGSGSSGGGGTGGGGSSTNPGGSGGAGGGGADGGGSGGGASQPSSPGVDALGDTAPAGTAAVNPSADTQPGIGLEAGPENAAQGPGKPQGPPTGGSPTDEQNFRDAREQQAARPTREQVEAELNERIRLGAKGGSPTEGRALTIDDALDSMAKGTRVTPSGSTRFHEQIFANLEERLGREASGNTPPAFTIGDGIRIDFNAMTLAQQQRFRELFKQQNPQR
jgi:hypothetical protein